MNYFGTTAYDPIEGSSTSIDPLNSLAVSVNLADLVFPGSSGRIWKIRYLSALCFLIQCAQTDENQSYKDNYLDFRPFENVFILASTLMKTEKDTDGLKGLMGTSKAARLIETSAKGTVDIQGEILSNQGNLGPLGVHQVLLRSLGLVNEDNLTLTKNGEILAEIYRKNVGDTGSVIQELGSKNRADIEKLKSRVNPENFSFTLSKKPDEAEAIFKLLIEDPHRQQLLKDITNIKINDQSDQEDEYVNALTSVNSSINQLYYKLIYNFENFERKLHLFFFHLLQNRQPTPLTTIKTAANFLSSSSESMLEFGGNFKELAQQLSGTQLKQYGRFIELLDNILPRLGSFEDLSHFIINELHANHQAYKHKAPWVRIEEGKVLVNPANIKYENDLGDGKLHRYRFANANSILMDLGKIE